MAGKSSIVSSELLEKARQDMRGFKDSKIYIRLLSIVRASNTSIKDIADFLGVRRETVSRWISNYSKYGIDGLKDRPRGHFRSKLDTEHKIQICEWIELQRDSEGREVHWTIEKLRAEIMRVFGISISYMPFWKHLRAMGFAQKVPRPCHIKADKEAQNEFKKNERHS